jgi:hypothetical protein
VGELIQLPVRYQGTLSKRELGRAINRSPRWIELRMRDDGLPFSRNADGHAQYDLNEVRAWMDERRKVARAW